MIIVVLGMTTSVVVSCTSSGPGGRGDADDASGVTSTPAAVVPSSTSTTSRSTEFRTTAGSTGPRIVIVGDSITNEGRAELAAALGVDHRVVIDGRPGYRVAQQDDVAAWAASLDPEVVVVELGTNDVLSGHDLERSTDDLRRLVGRFAGSSCVVLVTVATDLPSAGAEARARRFNRSIDEIAAADPGRIRVVDVDAVVRAAQSDPGFVGPFTYDGVHPTAAGHARLAAAQAGAVSGCGR